MPALNRQHVLITGAAQGLGAALARAFSKSGAKLTLIDVDHRALAEVGTETGATVIAVDLTDREATLCALATLNGPVDTLIHNAAILDPLPFAGQDLEGWDKTLDVGLGAGFVLSRTLWPEMQMRGGTLIFVSSQSGIKGFANEGAYCAAKHGLEGLSKCLALEGAPHNILSVTITPGMAMHTPMSERNYPPEMKKTWVDPIRLAPAFLHIAQQRDLSLSGRRLNAWTLSQKLESQR